MAAGLAVAAMAVAPRAWAQEGHRREAVHRGQGPLDLALCHELTNKPATAWAEFRQVIAESEGRREDRVTLAREHEKKLVAVGVWLAFGVVASNKNSDATGMCPDDRCPNLDVKNSASRTLASADNAATVANITAAAGSLLLVGGILLVLTALPSGTTPPRAKATALRAAPVPLMHGGGFVVGGAF